MNRILIVEDESAIANLIKIGLEKSGYRWDYAADGKAAADKLEQTNYDLVLLDIMLPVISGYELMEYIETLGIPVIFLTAKGSTRDKVIGLRMGADDYIVKPFEIDELLARIDCVLRRYDKSQVILYANDVMIDTSARSVTKNGMPIPLTPKEYTLLLELVRNKNAALYRETLFERVWQEDFTGDSRTLDLHIQRLRKKLSWQDKIKTVYKVGYLLEVKP